jgi:hypothetical protein
LSRGWGRWRRRRRGGCGASGWRGCWSVVRAAVEPAVKTEVAMSGQLALVMSETVVPAAVWETLPSASQHAIAVALARLVARLVEAARDE